MNTICTFWVNNRKLGTICSITTETGPIYALLPEKVSEKKVDLQPMDNKVVDEPLRSLSTNRYAVIMDKILICGDKMYQVPDSMPPICQWMAIPMVQEKDIIPYSKGSMALDRVFLAEGYARELADAYCILIPPTWDLGTCTSLDLLIKEVNGEILVPFSGRTLKNVVPKKTEGRYIFLAKVPEAVGDVQDLPYTYTLETLANKFKVLQARLQAYGTSRVESICACLSGISSALRESPNQFKAAQAYDPMATTIEKIKTSYL